MVQGTGEFTGEKVTGSARAGEEGGGGAGGEPEKRSGQTLGARTLNWGFLLEEEIIDGTGK
jgi:hypothetical protein